MPGNGLQFSQQASCVRILLYTLKFIPEALFAQLLSTVFGLYLEFIPFLKNQKQTWVYKFYPETFILAIKIIIQLINFRTMENARKGKNLGGGFIGLEGIIEQNLNSNSAYSIIRKFCYFAFIFNLILYTFHYFLRQFQKMSQKKNPNLLKFTKI
ncbi:hypothetical protein PPERSA_12104 [Pseudocohnilembus persalinus]|uniref:Transmembrane protein n=1 Tax=Pseudocohnilembus persalinus TaxID=266149 RepID=A0A0V0R903_PSEPJ|nr:hypothetical protein PPERSA_12104 [Pseudocohnilembus persalinus]|eukprot:KRX10980.1 hypothetical protein PPERSA_12104 [Pseudocohnilembus persalinus]